MLLKVAPCIILILGVDIQMSAWHSHDIVLHSWAGLYGMLISFKEESSYFPVVDDSSKWLSTGNEGWLRLSRAISFVQCISIKGQETQLR